jgi:hypothetical protein
VILRPPGLVALSSVSIAVFAEPFDFYLSSSFPSLETCHDCLVANSGQLDNRRDKGIASGRWHPNLVKSNNKSHPNNRRHSSNYDANV